MESVNKRSVLIVLLLTAAIVMGCFCISHAETPVNKVQVNKEYPIIELEEDNFEEYYEVINIPQNGRVKVWLKDCNAYCGTGITYTLEYKRLSDSKSAIRKWNENGDQRNSGWITVTPGEWQIRIPCDAYDKNTILFIEYQSSGQYTGETEDNNTFSTANPIASGLTYEGNYAIRTDSNSDLDYYKITMSEAGLLSISMENLNWSIYNVPFELYRTEENGNRKLLMSVESDTDYDRNTPYRYNVRVPKGEYYIKILATENECIEYTLKVDYHAESAAEYEQENNDSSRTANLLEKGVKYIGNLRNSEDVDWYKVVLEEKGIIDTELWIPENVGSRAVEITLYDSDLNEMYTEITDTDSYYTSGKKSVRAGTYYVCVKRGGYPGLDSTYDYRIQVNAAVVIEAVTNLKAVFEDYNKVKLTWTKSKGAAGYNVYSRKGTKGEYVLRGYTEDGEFLIEDLAPGAKYTFVIEPCRAKDDPVEGALNTVSGYTLKKVVQNKVKRYSSSKVTVSWKDISGESGYEVCKMTKKNGVYSTVKTCKTTKSYINIKGKKGVKYYYKVRAYKKSGGKTVYAPWSSVKAYKL